MRIFPILSSGLFIVGLIVCCYVTTLYNPKLPESFKDFESGSKYAVLVRINNPTESQIKRYFEWELSLSDKYDFWFLINPHSQHPVYRKKHVYYITMSKIYHDYPNISDLRSPGHCIGGTLPDEHFYMWISHTESIIEWYHYTKDKYDYVWILEQDLGVSGDLYKMLDKYSNYSSDFITYDVANETPETFPHFYCYTIQYLSWRLKHSNANKGYSTREFIQRWSRKLFNEINNELNKGMHAISETSVIETVIFNNLTYKLLYSNDIGYKFSWYDRISRNEWENILSKRENSDKFYHALKF